MPSLGADMDAGTIVEWLVHPGDEVHRGDIVAVVATDKADIEVEVFETGVVDEILVPAGESVPVGTPLARLRSEGAEPTAAPVPLPVEPPGPVEPAAPVARTRSGAPVSPVIRRLAKHLGVDLGTVAGSGPDGAITRADVEAAAERGAPAAPPTGTAATGEETTAPGDRAAAMRDALANLMARSKREIPHYYLATEVDFSRARDWLGATNATTPVTDRLLPVVLLLKAVALAAREHPEVNGTWVDGEFVPADAVNLGVAISLRGGGLIAPALADVDAKPLAQVAAELRDLVNRTRNGRLRAAEMSGPTLTVTNLGDQGVDRVFGVIYPPQVAIVGVGRITERPWARDGMVGAHPVVTISLSGDHRVSDGHRGGRFLARVDHLLQTPEEL
jgi:pyruvate dehydrogenase E2 component (dihydrolipoamide acetyltransferase)